MSGGCQRESTARPDLVFYVVDTLRADVALSAKDGHSAMPFLGELATQGAVFQSCRAPAPWTKPSMAALLTGRLPSRTGVVGFRDSIPGSTPLLAEQLRSAGYRTVGFSTNVVAGSVGGFDRGFDEFFESPRMLQGKGRLKASGSANRLVGEIQAWMRAQDANDPRPLFLFVHSVDPHEEYEPAEPYRSAFADASGYEAHRNERERLLRAGRQQRAIDDVRRTRADFEATNIDADRHTRYARSLYEGDAAANDAAIRELHRFLQERRSGVDSIWVVTSDHGEEFLEHGGTSHGFTLYDELLAVPLLFWGPGRVPERHVVTTDVSLIDVFPTIAELASLDRTADLDGQSLVPLWKAGPGQEPRVVFAERRERVGGDTILKGRGNARAVVRASWKLIHTTKPARQGSNPPVELYDLSDDPGETQNLAATHPEIVKEMRSLLERRFAAE